jgi:hypothetical protein
MISLMSGEEKTLSYFGDGRIQKPVDTRDNGFAGFAGFAGQLYQPCVHLMHSSFKSTYTLTDLLGQYCIYPSSCNCDPAGGYISWRYMGAAPICSFECLGCEAVVLS